LKHKHHMLLDKVVLGRAMPEVHRFKDGPAKYLGKHHRKLFHDHLTNILLGVVYGPEAFVSGELHDLLDRAESALKREIRRRSSPARSRRSRRRRRR
jgi:hypothetical protein